MLPDSAQIQPSPPPADERLPNTSPRDAATLVVLRRDGDKMRVLMGRRSERHVFHPGSVVFPGGRVARTDSFAPAHDELTPFVAEKLRLRTRTPSRARAIAMAAIRETYEEVGILIGAPATDPVPRRSSSPWNAFQHLGVTPTMSPLRFIARAITPPGRIRRFDARFFAVFADAIAAQVPPPEDELISPSWLTFEETEACQLPYITRIVIAQLRNRLLTDPKLEVPAPVVFHRTHHGKRVQELI